MLTAISFMFFKVTTDAYLLKISKTHNKNQHSLLNLLITCISAISGPQILSVKCEYVFFFQNFQIIGLSNSSANCRLQAETLATGAKSQGHCLRVIQLLTGPSEVLASKYFSSGTL